MDESEGVFDLHFPLPLLLLLPSALSETSVLLHQRVTLSGRLPAGAGANNMNWL